MIIKEMYWFSDGTLNFYFTSSDNEEVYLGNTYIPIPLSRSKNEVKNELSKANIQVNFSADEAFARKYLNLVETILTLTVFSKQDNDTPLVEFKGRLVSIKPQDSKIQLIFETVFTSLRRPGLRRMFQRNCPHILYGRSCNLNKNDFAISATATAFSRDNVTFNSATVKPDGYYKGGMIKSSGGILRFIIDHVGTNLKLIRLIPEMNKNITDNGSDSVTIYPGCDRSRNTCLNTFNNLPNNGSTPFIPLRDIFNGSSFT